MASLINLLCSFLSILSPETCYVQSKAEKEQHQALFVFGDSLFDPGNNQYLNLSIREPSSFWPYGKSFFNHPTGRLSDGRLVPDFIAQFANLPILSPYLEPGGHQFTDGTNFASAGAGVLVETNPGTINLPTQLSYFNAVVKSLKQKLGEAEANMLLSNAVYLFSIGGNDYFSFHVQNPKATQPHRTEYVKLVIANLTTALKEVYNLGGRKIAFQNAGPLGCVPCQRVVGGGCDEDLLALGREHNRALSQVLNNLKVKLAGFRYSSFDYYEALGDRVNSPFKYGFKEGKRACCGKGAYRESGCGGGDSGREAYELCRDPSDFVWFDGAHTTERANQQLAQLIWNGPPTLTGPYTVKQLFGYA